MWQKEGERWMDDDNEEKDTPLVDDDPEEKICNEEGCDVCVVSMSWLGCDAMAAAERVCVLRWCGGGPWRSHRATPDGPIEDSSLYS